MFTYLNKRPCWLMWVLLGLMASAPLGCSWPGAHLQHNWEVGNQFDDHHIFSEYQYFTGGTLDDPRGILALKTDYKLDSSEWQPVSMTPEQLAQWISALHKDFFVEENTFSNGANLIGQDGKIIGYYYSVWEYPLVRMPDEKTVAMAVPIAQYRLFNKFRMESFDDARGTGFH